MAIRWPPAGRGLAVRRASTGHLSTRAARWSPEGRSLTNGWPRTVQRPDNAPELDQGPRGGQLVATHRLIAGRCCPFHGSQRTLSGRGVTAGWPGISDAHSSPATAQVIARMPALDARIERASVQKAAVRAPFLVFRVSRNFWSSMSTLVQCLRALVLRSRDIAGGAHTFGA